MERQFLEFINDEWKYKSFMSYDSIYIDINNKIYKLNPKLVKSNMIEIDKPILKEYFIESLLNGTYETIFTTEQIYQTNIYVKQQGAGNGKTYGIVQLINDTNYEHYDKFIYLTKQHSAKHIIKSEIDDQIKKNLLNNITIIKYDFESKKHIITFKNNKIDKECKIVIATFDSFIYALGNKDVSGTNKFMSMVKSIIDDELKCSEDGYTNFANGTVLNKRLLLIGDEMQDLHENYMKAIIKITRERYVDFYAVGDKLQSISIENNAFTFLEHELPNDIINVQREKPTNICRRFTHPSLINCVNDMIPFANYKLEPVRAFAEHVYMDDKPAFYPFSGKTIYANETDEDKLTKEVDIIMDKYKYEVDTYGRVPNDFLIVTPFCQKNPLIEQLQLAIRTFWKGRFNKYKYSKYSIFHKSENGTSIDLSESDNATRIVSIHSSKGDGRNVVFVIGITESALKIYSLESNNLIFDSLLHVTLTRMKEKLYFRYEPNGDYIHTLLSNNDTCSNIQPCINITSTIKLSNILKYSTEYEFNEYNNNIISKSNIEPLLEIQEDKKLIDMKHHCIRYGTMYIMIILNVIANENKTNKDIICKQPSYQILNKLCSTNKIKYYTNNKTYYEQLNTNKDNNNIIPILEYVNLESEYKKYSDFLHKTIDSCIGKVSASLKLDKIIKFTYMESIILYHLIEISENRKYSALPIVDVYDIIDMHHKLNSENLYEAEHYKKLKYVQKLYNSFIKTYPNLKFLINHPIKFNGCATDYTIQTRHDIIAYNTDTVIICYIKPQFNMLNYNELLLQSIYDTYLIKHIQQNISEDNYNYKNLYGKKIISCVFTFDNNNKPYYIDWSNNESIDLIDINTKLIKDMIKKNTILHLQSANDSIFQFYTYWIKQFSDDEPIIIIEKLMAKYDENVKDYYSYHTPPQYIKRLFEKIENDIEYNANILNTYLDKTYFMSKLNHFINLSIDKYFGI